MNTEKVFTAFNKEGKEILLYRKDNNTYINLLSGNNDIYPKENIDIETLLPLNKSMYIFKNTLKDRVVKMYLKDRSKIIDTDNIIIGEKVTITNFDRKAVESGWYFYNIPLYNYEYKWDLTKKELGLYLYFNKIKKNGYEFDLYKNLFNHKTYYMFDAITNKLIKYQNLENGMEYVIDTTSTLKDIVKEPYLEKKLVYEAANDARKKGFKN